MTNELFDDPEFDEANNEYLGIRERLINAINEFGDTEDIGEGQIAELLLDIAIGMRTVDYLAQVEKPSASGLRLELDRMRKEFDEMARGAKKGAEERIELFRTLAAEVASEAEET